MLFFTNIRPEGKTHAPGALTNVDALDEKLFAIYTRAELILPFRQGGIY